MFLSYLLLPLGIAALDWVAVGARWKKLEYLTKPGTMAALLVWVCIVVPFREWGWLTWFVLGIVASLFGDVFLMLPREQFYAAWASFLLAHLAYIVGLNQRLPPINFATLGVVLIVCMTALRLYRRVSEGLVERGWDGFQRPALAYTIGIALMLISGLLTLTRSDKDWPSFPALMVSMGALLFFVSDTLLSWNRFVNPIKNGQLKVRITYHLGQIGIVAGALAHLLNQ